MKCPECQFDNPDSMKFCGQCGSKLESICPKCGFTNPPGFRFCGECGEKLGEEASSPTEVSVPKLEDMHTQLQSLIPDELAQKYMSAEQRATGENRPITALFADISGFTPLSNTQSSETMFQLVQDCFKELVGIVARYEGSISGFRGDGLLALFGAPILHENDAERAILAAIDMRDAIREHKLEISIGINTAMMTVGEVQTQLHSEYTAYGTDINLAKRLQEAAKAGQILVGTGTHRLTRRMFDFDTISDLTVKGFTQAVTAYTVQQVKEHPEKLRGIEGLRARMIGREHEFSDLKDATDSWLNGQGQIVSIIGEAGIGKSRLVIELRDYLNKVSPSLQVSLSPSPDVSSSPSPPPHVSLSIFEGRCVSIGQPISYWPFLDILRTYFRLGEDDDEATRARKVTELINQLMPQSADEALPLLGNLLSIKFGNELDDRLKFAGPEQIRHQTLMRLRDIFRILSEKQPLLLILEDLHWADDLSLDLISLLMDELANTSLMLLCVYRPEKEHRVWQLGDQARRKCLDRYTELTLHPLSSHQSRLLVESLLTIDNLPDSVKDTILTKSEGNPFFIEEVIRSLIEQDIVYQENDRWKARDEIANVSVPDTIQSVVLARVDRLQSEAKYVLQCASVIGRLFRYRLLRHISHQEQKLDSYLSDFESKELVHPERTVPELEYAFKHAFTQEATYEGILERKRKEFHKQVAESIERLYQDHLEEYYEELAHHYSLSVNVNKATEYLLKTANKMKRSYLSDESIYYFIRAIEVLNQHGLKRNDWLLEAFRRLGEIYHTIGEIPKAEEAFGEAIKIAIEMELPPREMARLYYWMAKTLIMHHKTDEVRRYGEMGIKILGDDTECVEAILMNSIIPMGEKSKWIESAHKNMKLIGNVEYCQELAGTYNGPYSHIINVALNSESTESAMKWAKELEARASQAGDPMGQITGWLWIADILRYMGSFPNSLKAHQKALEIANRIGDRSNADYCHFYIGQILLFLGKTREAEMHHRKALELAEYVGRNWSIAIGHWELGNIAMVNQDWDKAVSRYEKYIEEAQRSYKENARPYLSLGKALLRKGDINSALDSFKNSVNSMRSGEYHFITIPYQAFFFMEKIYTELGNREEFISFCDSFRAENPGIIEQCQMNRLYLGKASPSDRFHHSVSMGNFVEDYMDQSIKWMDEFGDSRYRVRNKDEVEIYAANGREFHKLKLDAPRFGKIISGDFALEACVASVSDDKPHIGGIYAWQNLYNWLCLDRGLNGKNDIHFSGIINGEFHLPGRGYLSADENDEIHLRLERLGDEFTSYCSTDGENWFTCGKMILPMEDPIQIGIHAIGMIDRTIYCGEYKEGTATVFRNFRIWTRE